MIDPPGRLVLLGEAVGHSMSPRFQNAALRAAGIRMTYETLDVPAEGFEATLRRLAAERAAGNVTIPHKEAVASHCARLSPLARRCGAVNVFWHEGGLLAGDNTDVGGFDAAASQLMGAARAGARVALIGAGGAAAAVLCAVERWEGAAVRVYNRHMPRAVTLARRFPAVARAVDTLDDALRGATLVVNATPIGRHDPKEPVEIRSLPLGAAVFDLVYRPEETAWVRAARDAGHRAMDGREMLLEQGALAFVRWFGREPDREAMRRAMV